MNNGFRWTQMNHWDVRHWWNSSQTSNNLYFNSGLLDWSVLHATDMTNSCMILVQQCTSHGTLAMQDLRAGVFKVFHWSQGHGLLIGWSKGIVVGKYWCCWPQKGSDHARWESVRHGETWALVQQYLARSFTVIQNLCCGQHVLWDSLHLVHAFIGTVHDRTICTCPVWHYN